MSILPKHQLRIEVVKLSELVPDPANARKHDQRNVDAVKASLLRFGVQKPIVVDANGVVVAGNCTLEAARALGWETIEVHRTELRGAEATAFAIADNRTAELASWDRDVLNQALASLAADDSIDELATGFDADEIERAIRGLTGPVDGSEGDDDVPEISDDIATKRGDLWTLGEHRLLCGDSTDAGDVDRLLGDDKPMLMATDPPYGVDFTGNNRPAQGKDWSADYIEAKSDGAGYQEFCEAFIGAAAPRLAKKAAIYLWHAHSQQEAIASAARSCGVLVHQAIIWVKPSMHLLGFTSYLYQHEPCLMGWMKGSKPTHHFNNEYSSVWCVDWEGKKRPSGNEHPAQKPIRLFLIPMENHTKKGDVVYEPFSGSGSQLIAAEKIGRRCRAMELSPRFVDVAVRRWEAFTGKTAELDRGGGGSTKTKATKKTSKKKATKKKAG